MGYKMKGWSGNQNSPAKDKGDHKHPHEQEIVQADNQELSDYVHETAKKGVKLKDAGRVIRGGIRAAKTGMEKGMDMSGGGGGGGMEISPFKQTDTTWADGTKKSRRQIGEQKIHPNEYWYKINGEKATKAEYIKYQNKPGGDEPGKQTNDPDVYGRKKDNQRRGPKN